MMTWIFSLVPFALKKGEDTVVITHSFINIDRNVFEWGPNSIGPGARLGKRCSVLPGVDVPADVRVPDYSICTAHGVWVVPENHKVKSILCQLDPHFL